jgi:hypothetical protein
MDKKKLRRKIDWPSTSSVRQCNKLRLGTSRRISGPQIALLSNQSAILSLCSLRQTEAHLCASHYVEICSTNVHIYVRVEYIAS